LTETIIDDYYDGSTSQGSHHAIHRIRHARSARPHRGRRLLQQLGASDIVASKRFYVERGLEVARSFGRRYVEFAGPSSNVKLALYGRRALAKDAGVAPDGTGSHRIAIGSDVGPFTDPDGFVWEAA
jgi:hypothetical protein